MTTFQLSYQQGRVYLKEEVRKILKIEGQEPGQITCQVNSKTALLIAKDATSEQVLKSLEILKRDIKIAASMIE